MGIAGKVALVTGAGQGIGRAIALRLAQEGADIALVDINGAKLAAVASEITAIGRKASVFIADVSKREQVVAAVEHAHQTLGGFDIIVNNAGVAQIDALLEVTPEQVERTLGINVQGVLWGIQAAGKKFKALGCKGFALLGVYSATKFAVRALTQAAAKELASAGITVNAYCPGVVGTDMWVEIDKRMAEITGAEVGATYKQYVDGIALGRAETPEDVAGLVAFLAGPDADYMTGQSPLIDGGLVYR